MSASFIPTVPGACKSMVDKTACSYWPTMVFTSRVVSTDARRKERSVSRRTRSSPQKSSSCSRARADTGLADDRRKTTRLIWVSVSPSLTCVPSCVGSVTYCFTVFVVAKMLFNTFTPGALFGSQWRLKSPTTCNFVHDVANSSRNDWMEVVGGQLIMTRRTGLEVALI